MEILGLLDTLESLILDGFKIPLTKKTLVNEEQILSVIDKIRLVVQGGEDFAKSAIGREKITSQRSLEVAAAPLAQEAQSEKGESAAVLEQAYQIAKEVRGGADNYADEVLSNLELTTTRILRTVQAGRERLQKTVQGSDNVSAR
jgi:cell division septum initiation protein DivIVA